MIISTPVNGSASMETSGNNLFVPGSSLWNAGLAKVRLVPPPPPPWNPRWRGGTTGGPSSGTDPPLGLISAIRVRFVPQPVSNFLLLLLLSAKLVPPTAVAFGELAG